MRYAEVAVRSDAPYRHPFTYSVPPGLALAPGQGVLVPFGRRTLQGVVLSISDSPKFEGQVRSLLDVATELPLLPPHLLDLARWISDRYLAPLFGCVSLLLPPGVERRTRVRLVPVEGSAGATGADRLLLAALAENPSADPAALARITQLRNAQTLIESMVRRGLVRRDYSLDPPSAGTRVVPGLRLTRLVQAVDVAVRLY